jgi:S-adenosylmethionine:tRNA ribosyltransferase-isomerase
MLSSLEKQGVEILRITLHIGLDTFAPVSEVDPRSHPIHSEWCSLPQEVASTLIRIKQAGGRIFAAGTTSVRTLESAARAASKEVLVPFQGSTDLFILPGYKFQVVDAMLTNFHLPRSTLLMLVSAFAGRERIMESYTEAIKHGYRFYSFGDAMLIL